MTDDLVTEAELQKLLHAYPLPPNYALVPRRKPGAPLRTLHRKFEYVMQFEVSLIRLTDENGETRIPE